MAPFGLSPQLLYRQACPWAERLARLLLFVSVATLVAACGHSAESNAAIADNGVAPKAVAEVVWELVARSQEGPAPAGTVIEAALMAEGKPVERRLVQGDSLRIYSGTRCDKVNVLVQAPGHLPRHLSARVDAAKPAVIHVVLLRDIRVPVTLRLHTTHVPSAYAGQLAGWRLDYPQDDAPHMHQGVVNGALGLNFPSWEAQLPVGTWLLSCRFDEFCMIPPQTIVVLPGSAGTIIDMTPEYRLREWAGHVTYETTGIPAGGAQVSLAVGDRVLRTTTDTAGRFRLQESAWTAPGSGVARLRLTHAGCEEASRESAAAGETGIAWVLPVVEEAVTFCVVGASEEVLADALIRIVPRSRREHSAAARTNELGLARIHMAQGRYSVQVSHAGHADFNSLDSRDIRYPYLQAAPKPYVIKLSATGSLRIRGPVGVSHAFWALKPPTDNPVWPGPRFVDRWPSGSPTDELWIRDVPLDVRHVFVAMAGSIGKTFEVTIRGDATSRPLK